MRCLQMLTVITVSFALMACAVQGNEELAPPDSETALGSVGRGLNRIIRKFELCFVANAGRAYEVRVSRSPTQPPRRGWRIQTALIADGESGGILDVKGAI